MTKSEKPTGTRSGQTSPPAPDDGRDNRYVGGGKLQPPAARGSVAPKDRAVMRGKDGGRNG